MSARCRDSAQLSRALSGITRPPSKMRCSASEMEPSLHRAAAGAPGPAGGRRRRAIGCCATATCTATASSAVTGACCAASRRLGCCSVFRRASWREETKPAYLFGRSEGNPTHVTCLHHAAAAALDGGRKGSVGTGVQSRSIFQKHLPSAPAAHIYVIALCRSGMRSACNSIRKMMDIRCGTG